MSRFAIGRYGSDDWRLIKWDGSDEAEIGSGWVEKPSLSEAIAALMDHHGTGDSPFNSRQGAIDAHILSNDWPPSVRDMTLSDETMPWNDT